MANWTLNQPQVISRTLERRGDNLVHVVRVRYADDSIPQVTQDKEYYLSGSDIPTQLARAVYDEQQKLQSGEAVVIGAITPQAPPAPTSRSAVETAYVDAVSNLANLKYLESIGVTLAAGGPIATAIANRTTAVQNAIDTPAKLNALLPLTPQR